MGFGIYSCMNGAKSRATELEVLANNIANIQTVGYKELGVAFHTQLDKEVSATSDDLPNVGFKSKDQVSFRDGAIYSTNNPLDIALQGDGFFEIQTPEGVRYSRNGQFTMNKNGLLVTQDGESVMGTNGPITLPLNKSVTINTHGDITAGDEALGRLKVSTFDDKSKLTMVGSNLYKAEGATSKDADSYKVSQGFLESANVNLVRNLTRIIEVSRSYETCQKAMSQQFEISRSLNSIAKG